MEPFSNSWKNYRIVFIPAHRSSRKICDILVIFIPNLNYLDIFYTNPPTSNFTKTHSVKDEMFHADRQMEGPTDRYDEANSCFRNFGYTHDAPK